MPMNEWVPLVGLAIQTLLILGGGYAIVVRADVMTKALRQEVRAMQEEVKGLTAVITTQAVHAERMDNMSKRVTILHQLVEDLRRGRGYVTRQDQVATTLDREY